MNHVDERPGSMTPWFGGEAGGASAPEAGSSGIRGQTPPMQENTDYTTSIWPCALTSTMQGALLRDSIWRRDVNVRSMQAEAWGTLRW